MVRLDRAYEHGNMLLKHTYSRLPACESEKVLRLFHDFPYIGDPGVGRTQLLEYSISMTRQQPCECRLATPR